MKRRLSMKLGLDIKSASIRILKEKFASLHTKLPNLCDLVEPIDFRYYSIASSPLVHPNEFHLFVDRVKYDTKKSAIKNTSPLLADTESLVRQRGAASNYLTFKSLPRYALAIELIAEEAGLKQYDVCNMKQISFRFHLSNERKKGSKIMHTLVTKKLVQL